MYYDTGYGNWPKVVSRLRELGVTHLRDGLYANESPEWRDWTERYYRAVELAAASGMRFDFGMGEPGARIGSIDELVAVAGGRLRHAAEALEAPNEFDKGARGRGWARRLADYNRTLFLKVKASPSLRGLPFVGPSFSSIRGPLMVGDLRGYVDRGNVHAYTGGLSPGPGHLRTELKRASAVSGAKPVWATEVGFHNALRSRSRTEQAPVSERVAAVYLLRTFLEHFRSGIRRTYAYELLDEKPERAGRDPEQHFGLLRSDFSRKPAFRALRNLLDVVGTDQGTPELRPLRIGIDGPAGVRRLVLRRPDGTYLVALWRLDSAWDRDRRRPLRVAPRRVTLALPGMRDAGVVDPAVSARPRPARLRGGRLALRLGASPVIVTVRQR
ncbi:MAG: hypothetical protein JW895_09770 [Thermoleophilaceae bacterium]|nr:hypothetical protein [Thermoleophilaceae bacterium]